MLSWLLNPNENHGLNDSIIRGFIQYMVTSFSEGVDVFDILLMDCHDFIIQREWKCIDILAVSMEAKFVLCIENKIDSTEHDDQLSRYRSNVEETYPDYKKMYIYLSPDGAEPSDVEYWCSMSYQDVLDIIENARRKVKLLPDAEFLINNYVETIRRDIVGDERLSQICTEIYAKHQKALDLIFENKPDRASAIAEIFRKWAIEKNTAGELEVALDKCSKTYTRFMTKDMSDLLPDAEEVKSAWKTKNYYFYELCNIGGNELYIQLVFNSRNIPDNLKTMCERINQYYPARMRKTEWQWRIPFSTKKSKIEEEISEEKIYEQLDRKLEDVKSFEKRLMGLLEQEN